MNYAAQAVCNIFYSLLAVDSWSFIDNPDGAGQIIATNATGETVVTNESLWQHLTARYHV
jgi:hypothetical protein